MCGRYVTPDTAAMEREFKLSGFRWTLHASYNVAPSQSVPALRLAGPQIEVVALRWGLVPFFSKGIIGPYSTINARIETISTSPSYRLAWRRGQRCFLPASGFYEWQVLPDGSKQPYYIRPAHLELFGFAGLWDRSVRDDGEVIDSCTIITMPANALMARIHNSRARMPAILNPGQVHEWCGADVESARQMLRPFPEGAMLAYPVGKRVNSPKNNDPQLTDPVNI